ncbi:kelch-like protein 15 [Mizuhopecten yessoensis]|uniref:TD and POZ domain-containing protein 1 n=1 Tax=Mizuhopecten yessoensis TaxID=6573 RepID=A0A210QRH9_MIZYE|nr:kelch-like protein 15 [Mizuhopecten yessoensis]OWF51335.1 TD and POZ domain-containing protein 1 [Mizuhopecten yessoensis]
MDTTDDCSSQSPDKPALEDDADLSCPQNLYFKEEQPLSDLILLVEGERLFASRSLLALASPVFSIMFTSEFKEKDQKEIELPGKKSKDIDELLKFLHPGMDDNLEQGHVSAFRLLPIAEEYQLVKLMEKCEDTILEKISEGHLTRDKGEFVVKCLEACARYGLDKLYRAVIQKCSEKQLLVNSVRKNESLPLEVKNRVFEERLSILENEREIFLSTRERLETVKGRLRAIIQPHENHCRCRVELKLRSNMQRYCTYCSRNWCSDHVSSESYRSSYWFNCNHRVGFTVANDGLLKAFIESKD